MNLKLEEKASLTQPNAQSNPGNHIPCVEYKQYGSPHRIRESNKILLS